MFAHLKTVCKKGVFNHQAFGIFHVLFTGQLKGAVQDFTQLACFPTIPTSVPHRNLGYLSWLQAGKGSMARLGRLAPLLLL